MPLLFITQINVGIYMVFGGPYVNRLFEVSASVLIMRQSICSILLLVVCSLQKKFNFKKTTRKDWYYTFLCGTLFSFETNDLGIFGICIPQYFSVMFFLSTTNGVGPFRMSVV